MRNIFYYVAYLIHYIGIISIAHIILLQAPSQEFLRQGQVSANQGTNFQRLFGTKLHENIQITLVNILNTTMQFNNKENHQNYIGFCYEKKKSYFLLLYHIRAKHIYFQAPDFSGAQLYLRVSSNMQNAGAKNQSVRSIETQLETLIFVSHYLNRLAYFVLNVFPSKTFATMPLQSEC